jgi:hypothetical protein
MQSKYVMLLREIICIYSEKHMKFVQIATLCEQMADFPFIIKTGGTHTKV